MKHLNYSSTQSPIRNQKSAIPGFFFLLPFYFLLLISCEKQSTPVQPLNPQVTLSAEAGVIEAWLTVTTQEAEGAQVLLTRDGMERLRFSAVAETTVVDTGLLPAHTYTYATQLLKNGQIATRSASVEITTLDTTSHDFNWEIFEFGGAHGSSVLYDVAIINENDIWAVGEIHTAETDTFDSLGNWVPPYNALHWDGSEWGLRRVLYDNSFWTIKTVFAFSSNDIWFSAFVRWNGMNFIDLPIPNILIGYGINKIWGTSSNDLYAVGTQGLIVRYNGQSWQKIEGGTELPIQDIWGARDEKTGESYILCPASDKFQVSDKKLLHIKPDHTITEILWPYSDRDPYSAWFKSENEIYVCGGGVLRRNLAGEYNIFNELPRIFMNRIRGNNINDVFVAGDFGLFAHYNGLNWWVYPNTFSGTFLSLDSREDLVVAVGERNAREALIMVLKRN